MAALFPQVGRIDARACIYAFVRQAGNFTPAFSHQRQSYSTAGGHRVEEAELRELRAGLVTIGTKAGFPQPVGLELRRQFDRGVARMLHSQMGITPHEASQPGVWEFLCCVLAPDLVMWRFPPKASERATESRFFGGVRNTLGRLWWRAEILLDANAEDRYHLLDELAEDELVQILERPAIAGCRPLARAIARHFIGVVTANDRRAHALRGRRMALMRDCAKRILRTGAVISYDVLDEGQIAGLTRIELAHACDAILKAPADIG